LVTAKHCVTQAYEKYETLYARLNTTDDSTELVELPRKWYDSPDQGVDVALIPFEPPPFNTFRYSSIGAASAASERNTRSSDIGIGNEVLVIGLFRLHHGHTKNIPIVRQGIISAEPQESFTDKKTGLSYSAYLAEIQSIGGLSGSPVFVHVPERQLLDCEQDIELRNRARQQNPAGFLFLLGLVRGHFDEVDGVWPETREYGNGDKIHSGIATVTPIEEVLKIVAENEELKNLRDEHAQKYKRVRTATNDSAVSDTGVRELP